MYKVLVQVCVVCCATPPGPPLYGCEAGHLVCLGCRQVSTTYRVINNFCYFIDASESH